MKAVVRIVASACVLLGCMVAAPQPEGANVLAQEDATVKEGRELFNTYCASCHGRTGTGNGPVAASMRRSPPDITGLALANGGLFPAERLARIIDGREVESHGDREMPVWGDGFKAVGGGGSEEAVRSRIRAVLAYLRSIQKRRA